MTEEGLEIAQGSSFWPGLQQRRAEANPALHYATVLRASFLLRYNKTRASLQPTIKFDNYKLQCANYEKKTTKPSLPGLNFRSDTFELFDIITFVRSGKIG